MKLILFGIPQEMVGAKDMTYLEELGGIMIHHRGSKIDLELEIDDEKFTKEVLKKCGSSLLKILAAI